MRYILDHDLHIHSQISLCSNDPGQTSEFLVEYAKKNGLKHIVLTNHYWDENVAGASDWYQMQNYAHISKALPLPNDDEVTMHFGCETEMDQFFTVGISPAVFDKFDFIIIPTTHLHMVGYTISEEDVELDRLREVYLRRLDALLNMDLPFHKVGIPHLTSRLIGQFVWEKHLALIDGISDDTFRHYFTRIAEKGAGVEINVVSYDQYQEEGGFDSFLRVFRLAKECGCKFYFASDAHHPYQCDRMKERCEAVIDALDLKESDKFSPFSA